MIDGSGQVWVKMKFHVQIERQDCWNSVNTMIRQFLFPYLKDLPETPAEQNLSEKTLHKMKGIARGDFLSTLASSACSLTFDFSSI